MAKKKQRKDERNYFAFFLLYKNAINELDALDRLLVYEAITDFGLFGKAPNLERWNTAPRVAWRAIEPLLKIGWTKYTNGKKGGAPIGNTNACKDRQLAVEKTT